MTIKSENPACSGCDGPHPFDTTIPSDAWNAVIRANDLSEYLCLTCIVQAFVSRGVGFTATLWGKDFDGVGLVVTVESAQAESERKEKCRG